jgi:hypothetical protein
MDCFAEFPENPSANGIVLYPTADAELL